MRIWKLDSTHWCVIQVRIAHLSVLSVCWNLGVTFNVHWAVGAHCVEVSTESPNCLWFGALVYSGLILLWGRQLSPRFPHIWLFGKIIFTIDAPSNDQSNHICQLFPQLHADLIWAGASVYKAPRCHLCWFTPVLLQLWNISLRPLS